MYTLLSGTYKYLTRREEYYVMIIGLDNAGKTVRKWSILLEGTLWQKVVFCTDL
jgi:hypothetical protein